MTRHSSACALTVGIAAVLAACSTIQTVHDSDPSADFTRYRTWDWISDENLIGPKAGEVPVSYVSPLDEQRIRRAVEADLAAKGYRKVGRAEADLIVSFTVGTEEKTRVYSTPTVGGYYDDFGYGGWYGGSEVRTQQYTEGTLSVQFFERESKNAVWVGWASKRVSRSDDSDEVIREAITRILEEFPARS
jgi:hypothetical protein